MKKSGSTEEEARIALHKTEKMSDAVNYARSNSKSSNSSSGKSLHHFERTASSQADFSIDAVTNFDFSGIETFSPEPRTAEKKRVSFAIDQPSTPEQQPIEENDLIFMSNYCV